MYANEDETKENKITWDKKLTATSFYNNML